MTAISEKNAFEKVSGGAAALVAIAVLKLLTKSIQVFHRHL
jgi:hypothetical protein